MFFFYYKLIFLNLLYFFLEISTIKKSHDIIYMHSKRNKYFVLLIIQIDKIHFIGFMSSIIFLILYSAIHKAYGVGILTQGGLENDKRSKNKEKCNNGK